MKIVYYDGTTETVNSIEFGASGRTLILDGARVVDAVAIIRIVTDGKEN